MWTTLRDTVLPSGSCEDDPGFRDVLQEVARKGMRVGAVLGMVIVVMFIGVHTLVLGRGLGLSYGDGAIVIWDKLILVGIAVAGLVWVRFLRLDGIRLLVAVLVAAAAFASVADDVAGGDTSFAQGYVGLIYLIGVLAVPYRPVHTFALGIALGAVLFGAVDLLPGVLGTAPIPHVKGQYVYLASVTILLSGMSGLLYSMRFAQYRERRRAEELHAQVEALEAAKSRFFVNVSHEFRTPLTLLRGPLDDILAGRHGDVTPSLLRRVQEMRRETARLGDLVDQLLDLSKLADGIMPLHAREIDLCALAVRCVSVFESAMERKQVALRLDVPAEPVRVWCDPEKMERVVSNLMSNALKYTPSWGTIRVRLRQDVELEDDVARPVGHALLSIRDSGEGIEPELVSMVFERFAGAGVIRDGQASTGIGLALVKEIVVRHGGTVDVKSEPGFGAEFTVRMPLGRDHLAPEDVVAARPGRSAEELSRRLDKVEDWIGERTVESDDVNHGPGIVRPDGRWRQEIDHDAALEQEPERAARDAPLVVLVEDNEAVRAYLRDLLAGRYRLAEAADAEAGFALCTECRPSLVISDVMMPGDGGFELCRKIRSDAHLAATPVVLLTALAEEDARRTGLAAGADAYLTKPFSSDELLLIAENLIEIRRMLRSQGRLPEGLAPSIPTIPSREAEFLDRLRRSAAAHLGDANFGIEWLADEVGLSPRQLQRRLKASIHLTPAGFIKALRFERAAQLLAQSDLQVQEVADAVGYRDVGYFSKLFREIHGVPPSEFATARQRPSSTSAPAAEAD